MEKKKSGSHKEVNTKKHISITPPRDRTENLLLRRQAPYPLGQGGTDAQA